jgi:hypothetical protein
MRNTSILFGHALFVGRNSSVDIATTLLTGRQNSRLDFRREKKFLSIPKLLRPVVQPFVRALIDRSVMLNAHFHLPPSYRISGTLSPPPHMSLCRSHGHNYFYVYEVYRVLVGKPEGKRPLGRPRRRR